MVLLAQKKAVKGIWSYQQASCHVVQIHAHNASMAQEENEDNQFILTVVEPNMSSHRL